MKKNTSGFTLVEVIISLVVLTTAAFGITQFLIWIQYSAQDNLYESVALNMALNTLEQMKSTNVAGLETSIANQTFVLTKSASEQVTLRLGQENREISVPIVTNDDDVKNILISLTPSITTLEGDIGFLLRVEYEYRHPRNDRPRTKVLSCIRSRVPVF